MVVAERPHVLQSLPDVTAKERPKIVRTFRTRAYLSKAGHKRFDEVLWQQTMLYNAALEERREAYRSNAKETLNFYSQNRSLTQVRADFAEIEGAVDRRIQVETLRRLQKAFDRFFKMAKDGNLPQPMRRRYSNRPPGYPRFKSRVRFKTLEVYSGASRYVRHDAERGKGVVRIKGLPLIRFKDKRVPEGVQP